MRKMLCENRVKTNTASCIFHDFNDRASRSQKQKTRRTSAMLLQNGFDTRSVAVTIAQADPSHYLLSEHIVRHADDVRLDDKRMGVQNLFNFAGTAIV